MNYCFGLLIDAPVFSFILQPVRYINLNREYFYFCYIQYTKIFIYQSEGVAGWGLVFSERLWMDLTLHKSGFTNQSQCFGVPVTVLCLAPLRPATISH